MNATGSFTLIASVIVVMGTILFLAMSLRNQSVKNQARKNGRRGCTPGSTTRGRRADVLQALAPSPFPYKLFDTEKSLVSGERSRTERFMVVLRSLLVMSGTDSYPYFPGGEYWFSEESELPPGRDMPGRDEGLPVGFVFSGNIVTLHSANDTRGVLVFKDDETYGRSLTLQWGGKGEVFVVFTLPGTNLVILYAMNESSWVFSSGTQDKRRVYGVRDLRNNVAMFAPEHNTSFEHVPNSESEFD